MISIIIVNWNTCEYLRQLLGSLERFAPQREHQVLVIDNASADGSPAMVEKEYPGVVLLQERANLGFSHAVNLGINRSMGSYKLLINSDCLLVEPIIDEMVDQLEKNPSLGILAPLLVYPDGTLQSAGEPPLSLWTLMQSQLFFSKSPLRMRFKKRPQHGFKEAGFVSGACFLFRAAVMEQIGSFREDFFMYGEDADFCYRARKAGWRVGVCTFNKIVHHKAASTKQNLFLALSKSMANNMQLIYEQQGRAAALAAMGVYFGGTILRSLYAAVSGKPTASDWVRLLGALPKISFTVVRFKKGR